MTQPIDEAARRRRHRNERIAATVGIAILLVALAWFIRWNRAEEERVRREQTYIPPDVTISAEMRLLQQYVRIDTSNPPGNEIAGAKFLAAQFAAAGIPYEIAESAPGRASIYARLRGKQSGGGLLLLNHIDVVPARGEWKSPPFSGEIALATLYGRGTLDVKGLAICQLAAFLDVARSGRQPEHDLVFLAVADEETGGKLGMAWLLDNRPAWFEGVGYAIGEGGVTEMRADQLTYFAIEIGAKQYAWVELDADALEPLLQARWILEPYYTSFEPERVLPEVKNYFHAVAPTRINFRDDLIDVDATLARGKFWRLPKAYRDLTQTMVSMHWPLQRKDGGWQADLFVLMLSDEDPEERIAWLRRKVEPLGIRPKIVLIEPKTGLSSSETPLFRIIAAEAQREYRAPAGPTILYRSTNDSRYLRRRGIECYGISPYLVDAFQSETIHGVDEQIRLDRFQRGVELTRRIVKRWADSQ